MTQQSVVSRFHQYQKERFPIALLVFTTLAVVLSTAAIMPVNIGTHSKEIVVGTVVCLLFMLNVRISDEHKDYAFDSRYHAGRPVQRGLISLRELDRIAFFSLATQFVLTAAMSFHALFFWIAAMLYHALARKEFFVPAWIRKRFIFYNAVNLLQIMFLQIYLYALFGMNAGQINSLVYAHAMFVLGCAALIEIARKMKGREDESKGRDTYSGRYPFGYVIFGHGIVFSATYALFIFVIRQMGAGIELQLLSSVFVFLLVGATAYYARSQNKVSSNVLQGMALLFYVALNILVVAA